MTWPSGEALRALRTRCVHCTSSDFFFFSRGETPNNLCVFLSPDSHCPIWNLASSAVEPSVGDIKTKLHQGMLLSRSRQDSCVAQATDPAHAGACNFSWPISSGTHLFTRPAKQSRDRWDFLWSPALPPRGKPGHLYCHLTAKLVRPCTGHVRDTCSVWVLCTGSCCPCCDRLVPGHIPLC